MALNKAERAMVEALQTRLALRWPANPPVPVDPTTHMVGGVFKGWLFNEYSGEVSQGSTNGTYHHRSDAGAFDGNGRRQLTTSQTTGGPWYLTKVDALHALHYAVAKRCAAQLRQVEARIEAELAP